MIIDKVPHVLREMIRNKQACLVLGAGVSIASSNNHPTSSWKGLLKNGISHCKTYGTPPLNEDASGKLLEILELNDIDNWLAIATLIERKLKYPNNPEWNSWLYESVGSIKVKNYNLLESIISLELPILTTNYDNLFSDKSLSYPKKSITWKDRSSALHFKQNPLDYIFHLHGSFVQADSVVLGISSYEHLINSEFIQYIQRSLSLSYGFIFIGYGAGFDDPNFSALIRFLSSYGTLSPNQKHFVLVKEGDQFYFNNLPNIYPVVYGEKHEDLPVFLRTLPFSIERFIYRSKRKHAEHIKSNETFKDMAYCPDMVFIESGTAQLKDKGKIEIRKPIAMGRFPVTVEEWNIFVHERGYHYRKFTIDNRRIKLPITGISYYDAIDYTNWLSEITGYKYRLPSENEWEYAALAGNDGNFWWGEDPNVINANFRDSKLGELTNVDTYPANKFNLQDFFGNCWEWTDDNYSSNRAETEFTEKPYQTNNNSESQRSNEHILKGGCFYYSSDFMKASSRIHLERESIFNSVGFRVVREVHAILKSDDFYYILSISSPFAIDFEMNKEMKPTLSYFNMSESQLWNIKIDKNNLATISHYKTKKTLCYSEDPQDYSTLKMSETLNDVKQRSKYSIKKILGGYMIVSSRFNKVVDLEGARKENIPDLIMFEPHGNFNQGWHFIPVKF
ncbi:SUMF1/EgtB/PvdO family nonheme iron enzyme [Mucilaginibacter psychrotolerans]|uniref:Sulfatase-modifying factor enzyme-like domain-containing protein n=1 Tax=Mucilaginibacter psychrotolerans TaxID=1524096 RepID=A0A4Y8SG80_9SPHI|nr:SUMF1/EgtB/PvdO family nonheme iron enzyme [Mucilaginibacter psychrotolerans]TFF37928.1 hypothetical protein E2R66_10080 [Mucilaginibacter psychrotolerans]